MIFISQKIVFDINGLMYYNSIEQETIMARKKSTKYLNNKDMLREIHSSKLSYCYAMEDKFMTFDLIVEDINDINDETIQQAKENKARRLSGLGYEKGITKWDAESGKLATKPKQAEFKVDASTIDTDDVVIRVMTYNHIPEAPGRKKNPKTVADKHERLNFPPFQHHACVDGTWQEVLRSHWQDGFANGSFRLDHGGLTPELAKMMMKLVERYAMRGNWRGYSYRDEMESSALLQLSEVGLKFNEARSDNPFAYYTQILQNSFTRVLNLEKRNQHIRDDILQDSGYMPSFNRQIDDEVAQQRAREDDIEKGQQELKDRGYNIL
tara:strand:+ start:37 stop:1008 length:972 start_codon:yes stop_codon:yes gene_type:complete